jgi:hypothetical protein
VNLSPKALQTLESIKANIVSGLTINRGEQKAMELSTDAPKMASKNVTITVFSPLNRGTSTPSKVRMRHAKGSTAFQRMCRRHDWASPVY